MQVMGRSLSPVVRRELENLDKDADSRKLAIKALKSHVKELDSKTIPLFLAKVSETKETGSSAGEHTISLYEVMARVHGQKIIPLIDNIMTTIVKTLTTSAGPFALHQACSKVVPAIARYGIDPATPEDKKKHIIHSLSKPLSDCLLGSNECLSSGSALCLKALVECDNWRFASNEMVNEVCQRVAAALDKHTQTNSHMALVMSLAKHNSLTLEAYARLFIRSGLQIMNEDVNSQKRLSAIHMVNCLMKCLDPKSLFSELEHIIKVMENCQTDHMAYVSGAAYEALLTARKIFSDISSKFDRDMVGLTRSNFDKRADLRRRYLCSSGNQSPVMESPESQSVDSFFHDSVFDSPHSTNQASPEFGCNRSVNRKLWSMDENSAVNISLKDGIFSELIHGDVSENSEHQVVSENCGGYSDAFMGFSQANGRIGFARSSTNSPQRSRSQINIDNVKIFATPRKLIRSLQDPSDDNSNISDRHNRRYGSPSSQFERTPTSKYEQNGVCVNYRINEDNKSLIGTDEAHGSYESVSSTEDVLAETNLHGSPRIADKSKLQPDITGGHRQNWKFISIMFAMLFILVSTISAFFLTGKDDGHHLVPT